MQYAKLPKTLCDEMEKIQRGFLWGDTDQVRKPHLVSWNVCCLPKKDGGLRIKNPHQMNEAFLMKMSWNLINRPDDLWCKVLYSKYGRNNYLRTTITSLSYDSPLWKALTGIWDKFQQNIVWNLGNGNHINFWLDKWTLSGDSLINTTSQPVIDTTLSVRDVLNSTGDWNHNFLNDNLPVNIVNQILAIPAPTDLDGPDTIGWGGTTTRHFTVQSAYKFQKGHYQPLAVEWKALWDWIFKNITNHFNGIYEVDWISTFMVACWHLWTWRNKSIFEEGFQRPHEPTFATLKVAKEIEGCSQDTGSNRKSDTIYIGWKIPQEGWIKLNCDGSQNDRVGLAGRGGLLWDSNGKWIKGYSRKIGSCDALHAEMWGMYVGMNLAWSQRITHLHVESDSKVLIDMVTERIKLNGSTPTLVVRIRNLLALSWQVILSHTWHEGNRSTDWLANFSYSLDSFDIHVLETPHRELPQICRQKAYFGAL
ncbi:hypothetical protein TSUD_137780 [Trifolium subterraneum]|uniref:RNase H type-1 domain-containing protein n=1 Tax=Trifolium subterraneum TaxID=3900 RepID=A0A2Z6P3H2_TRISU|nr:hypothetical protein TSUD_137780 [Trifolium subterraneum]